MMPRERDCPQRKNHTPNQPVSYLAWHEWAEKKMRTHRQVRCVGCGLYTIWKPKKRKPQHEHKEAAVACSTSGSVLERGSERSMRSKGVSCRCSVRSESEGYMRLKRLLTAMVLALMFAFNVSAFTMLTAPQTQAVPVDAQIEQIGPSQTFCAWLCDDDETGGGDWTDLPWFWGWFNPWG